MFRRSGGTLCRLTFYVDGVKYVMHPGEAMRRLRDDDLVARTVPLLTSVSHDVDCKMLAAVLRQRPYSGEATLSALGDPVFFEIDEAIVCQPDGLLLLGWHLAMPDIVKQIRYAAKIW